MKLQFSQDQCAQPCAFLRAQKERESEGAHSWPAVVFAGPLFGLCKPFFRASDSVIIYSLRPAKTPCFCLIFCVVPSIILLQFFN